MVVLVYNQGLNFFSCLYDYKLVEAGFSRDTSNTIGNIVIIPIIALTFCFGGWTSSLGGNRNAIMFCTAVMVAICLYLLLVFPTDVFSISVVTFALGLLDSWRFYSFGVLINSFPLHALSESLIYALLKALEYLYNHRVVHRDIKPENILFNGYGQPFLTDFGIASYNESEISDSNSGTLGYMSPEVMQSQSHSYTADYYAIGVIAF
ncbi:spindle assembly checkpoint kinase [Nymphaea colorata]|nr:spindle assembly checkpoint kinase [Nymphaea colorata]